PDPQVLASVPGSRRASEGVSADVPPAIESGGDRQARDGLFARLRQVRKQIADAKRVPAYIVFSDATLVAMAERNPETELVLLAVPGIGPKKLASYGEEFLAAIRAWRGENP